jgi:NADPH-dependent curcumin reductase CurA
VDRQERRNRQLVLRRRPRGLIADADYVINEIEIPSLQPGDALVRTTTLSMEAGIRRVFDMAPFGVALPCWGAGGEAPAALQGNELHRWDTLK